MVKYLHSFKSNIKLLFFKEKGLVINLVMNLCVIGN